MEELQHQVYGGDPISAHLFILILKMLFVLLMQTNIITKCGPYNKEAKKCQFCLKIALHEDDNLLNKRQEVVSKCSHQNKFSISKYDMKD